MQSSRFSSDWKKFEIFHCDVISDVAHLISNAAFQCSSIWNQSSHSDAARIHPYIIGQLIQSTRARKLNKCLFMIMIFERTITLRWFIFDERWNESFICSNDENNAIKYTVCNISYHLDHTVWIISYGPIGIDHTMIIIGKWSAGTF